MKRRNFKWPVIRSRYYESSAESQHACEFGNHLGIFGDMFDCLKRNNDINAVRNLGLVPQGYYVNRRFTDTNGYFITPDVPNGAKVFNRTPLQTQMQEDFDTGNLRFKARERYSFGVSDWRGYFGSAGS